MTDSYLERFDPTVKIKRLEAEVERLTAQLTTAWRTAAERTDEINKEKSARFYAENELKAENLKLRAQLASMQNCHNCRLCIDDCVPPCQGKCTKWEWEGAAPPASPEELHILKLGEHGYRYCPYREWYVALLELIRASRENHCPTGPQHCSCSYDELVIEMHRRDKVRAVLESIFSREEKPTAPAPLPDDDIIWDNAGYADRAPAAPNAPNARRQTLNPVACAPTRHSQEPIAGSPDSQDRDGDGKAAADVCECWHPLSDHHGHSEDFDGFCCAKVPDSQLMCTCMAFKAKGGS
jgi:hypothetical protein